jgi:hypothetical protein
MAGKGALALIDTDSIRVEGYFEGRSCPASRSARL